MWPVGYWINFNISERHMYHGYGDTPLPSVDAILMALLNCESPT
jgi:hypothetical protein